MRKSHTSGVLLILLAASLWGTTGTAQSFATLSLSSYWVGSARLLVAGGFFVLWIAVTDHKALTSHRMKAMPWPLIATAAACMAIYNLAFFSGVRISGVAIGTAIALGSGPIWAGALQALWYKKLPGNSWWLAVTVAISGLVVATVGPSSVDNALPLPGILLCLLSGVSYALYALVSKQMISSASAVTTTAMVFMLAAALAVPAAWAFSGTPDINPADIPVLLWLGIVATGVAYLLFNIGLQYVSSATGVALALAEPIAALILAIVIVGERLTALSLVGMLLVFAGLYLLVRAERTSD